MPNITDPELLPQPVKHVAEPVAPKSSGGFMSTLYGHRKLIVLVVIIIIIICIVAYFVFRRNDGDDRPAQPRPAPPVYQREVQPAATQPQFNNAQPQFNNAQPQFNNAQPQVGASAPVVGAAQQLNNAPPQNDAPAPQVTSAAPPDTPAAPATGGGNISLVDLYNRSKAAASAATDNVADEAPQAKTDEEIRSLMEDIDAAQPAETPSSALCSETTKAGYPCRNKATANGRCRQHQN